MDKDTEKHPANDSIAQACNLIAMIVAVACISLAFNLVPV
jgi:hypothetical protein